MLVLGQEWDHGKEVGCRGFWEELGSKDLKYSKGKMRGWKVGQRPGSTSFLVLPQETLVFEQSHVWRLLLESQNK